MKYTLSAIILSLVVLFSGADARAQSLNKLSAKIDFDFHVAGKKFEAGDYIIEKVRPQTDSDVYHLRRVDEKAQTLFIMRLEKFYYPGLTEDNFTLRFNRYGNEYFLSSIYNSAAFKARLPKSKAELQIARQFPKCPAEEIAANSGPGK